MQTDSLHILGTAHCDAHVPGRPPSGSLGQLVNEWANRDLPTQSLALPAEPGENASLQQPLPCATRPPPTGSVTADQQEGLLPYQPVCPPGVLLGSPLQLRTLL